MAKYTSTLSPFIVQKIKKTSWSNRTYIGNTISLDPLFPVSRDPPIPFLLSLYLPFCFDPHFKLFINNLYVIHNYNIFEM